MPRCKLCQEKFEAKFFNQKYCLKDDCQQEHFRQAYKKSKKRSTKRKQPIRKKRKPSGEAAFFRSIWENRPHRSWISGERLGPVLKPIYFFHILPKGSYPAYRLNPDNIILTTEKEHRDWHSKPRSELLKINKNWQRVFDLYDALKRKYYS